MAIPEPDNTSDPIVSAIDDAEPRSGPPSNGALAWEPCNDWGNARRLIARKGEDLAWSPKRGWLGWDGRRFDADNGDVLVQLAAQEVAAQIAMEADALKERGGDKDKARAAKLYSWCTESGNSARLSAMVRVAAPHLVVDDDEFDADNWKVTAANCTLRIDPKTAEITPYDHRRADRITKRLNVPYDPDADAPTWREFIGWVLPDDDVAVYVQKWCGYWLSGCTAEQIMCFFHGPGQNGKSTLVEVIAETVMGDYEATAPIAMFLHRDNQSGGEGPTPSMARLPGVRMLRTAEPDPGMRLAEGMIKKITGGERQEARHLRQDVFEFKPQVKLTMGVNSPPVIIGKDKGIRRRLRMVPFTQHFEPPKGYHDRLMGEGPGILNWMLDGLRLYLEHGLGAPEAVRVATQDYFDEMDPIGSFLADAIEPDSKPDDYERPEELYGAYELWSKGEGREPKSRNAFFKRLNDLGYQLRRSNGLRYRTGIRLKDDRRPVGPGLREHDND